MYIECLCLQKYLLNSASDFSSQSIDSVFSFFSKYENMWAGEFILYQHTELDVEVSIVTLGWGGGWGMIFGC